MLLKLLILALLFACCGPTYASASPESGPGKRESAMPECLITFDGLASGTFFKVEGNRKGEAVLLLHGLHDTHANFAQVARALSKDYWVVSYDVRGFGASPANGFDYSTATLAKDAIAILDRLGIEKAHLVGHSLGGRTAVQLAALFPERVLSLVVEDIDLGVREFTPPMEGQKRAIALKYFCPRSYRSETEMKLRLKAQMGSQGSFLATYHHRDRTTGRLTLDFEPYAVYLWPTTSNGENLLPAASKVTAPMLILRGDDSFGMTPQGVADLRVACPSVPIVTIPNAGHYVHEDQPEKFIGAVAKFLNEVKDKN